MELGQFNIQALRRLSSARSLLSCTADGAVNLSDWDDSSGRQRWDLELVDSGFFSLKASGGINDPSRAYLSFNDSGTVRLGARPENLIGCVWTLSAVTTTPQIPAYYTVAPAWWPGVTGLLECSADGAIVKLAPDRQSARQRWQFQGPSFADNPFAGIHAPA